MTDARILLKANCNQEQGGWTDQAIHQAIDVSLSTIARVRQIFVEQGLDAALNSKPSSQLRLRKLDGVAEAGLIACCCSQPPPGRKEWTLRLLADEMVKLEYVNSISHETVRWQLGKLNVTPKPLKLTGVLPPKMLALSSSVFIHVLKINDSVFFA